MKVGNKVTLSVAPRVRDHIRGDLHAQIVLVEYGDFACPHCKAAYSVVKRLQEYFGARLAFIFRNFPLVDIHEMALAAAEATEIASNAGKFWEMHDAIFEDEHPLSIIRLTKLAEQIHVDQYDFFSALKQGTYVGVVKHDINSGEDSGVPGTPTFFINGRKYFGVVEFEEMADAISQFLPGQIEQPERQATANRAAHFGDRIVRDDVDYAATDRVVTDNDELDAVLVPADASIEDENDLNALEQARRTLRHN